MILKFRIPGLAIAFSAMLLVVSGCGEDNESALKAQANAPVPEALKNTPPPKNQAEFGERSKQGTSQNKSSGYPGAKK